MNKLDKQIAALDQEIWDAVAKEQCRQEDHIELIASENYASNNILALQGSILTNKYAEGYPGKRYYSGCEYVDIVENIAIERAKSLFGASYANVQPHSGSQANAAAYMALLQPGDTILGMGLDQGGHLTHGARVSFAGKYYNAVSYGLDENGEINYVQVAELAQRHKPKLIIAGFSAYSRTADWQKFREIADSVGAYMLADIAHVAGLICTGLYPSPVNIADVTTSTTHKTLRGPRGGIILAKENPEIAKKLNSAVFPGTQGGPLMHVIAAKAAAFKEASTSEFISYQQQTLKNARHFANGMINNNFKVVSGGTDNHLFLLDFVDKNITGKDADDALSKAFITVNKNSVPNDPRSPMVTSGIRIGTPAITTRGFKEEQIDLLITWICDVLNNINDQEVTNTVKDKVKERQMQCPFCQAIDTKVIDSRAAGSDGQQIRRRRECINCMTRFTTYETVEIALPRVQKKDGSYVQFNEDKIRSGILRALEKRSVPIAEVDLIIKRITNHLRATGEREVSTQLIGEWIMTELKALDAVAYVRFASVYRRFEDVEAFNAEIELLKNPLPGAIE